MKERIKTSRKLELDKYLVANVEVSSWTYDGDDYIIWFQDWVCDYRIEQIMKLIKECILEDLI